MIDTKRLEEIFLDVLLNDDEVNEDKTGAKEEVEMVRVEGIAVAGFGFQKQRLENHREEVKNMLEQLSDRFKEGASFLEGCDDKNGNQWGGHRNMEQLFCLGIGLGYAEYCLPRKIWASLPGEMPYIYIKSESMDLATAESSQPKEVEMSESEKRRK